MKIPDQYKETFDFYIKKGLSGRVGLGQRPALIVIDMIRGFIDLTSPLAIKVDSEIEAMNHLLGIARTKQIPIIFSTVAYNANLQDAGIWIRKTPSPPQRDGFGEEICIVLFWDGSGDPADEPQY
jgi:nicotinamidase-related amidase